ncbi:DUF4097 family beta strand repeat-containing protein [Aeromicrobium chenweiae]|uniref:DUF4097 domain-containing protein n=1 Tax=Aeromicrobium chenweiae TaxID=2079793 RepID=A0A2S0WK14_9ACTN|nr:DUF4097 family beta strand repeat-containing protein [Aeromicrobium chenweiae]AWB91637.1 hypothetical protein C3E78_05070 [Aeromicrobium chenweiae]TGN32476.1 hypothetical protein E4L97_07030 [Aeromicrobium chenweiae]
MTDQEVIADYDVRSPASRTLLTVVGTIVFVAVVGGLVLGASVLSRDTKVSTSVVEIGDSAQIVIDAGSADVRIVQGGPDVVRVKARITSGLLKTDFEIGRRGDDIKIASGCKTWLNPGCGVETTVAIPKGFPVVVKTGSGDVAAAGIDEGVLTVRTGSGNISGTALDVDELAADTVSGDISADFRTQPFALKASTRDGNISASLPQGDRTYGVEAKSTSGDVSYAITPDEDGKGFIRAITKSGDISLRLK